MIAANPSRRALSLPSNLQSRRRRSGPPARRRGRPGWRRRGPLSRLCGGAGRRGQVGRLARAVWGSARSPTTTAAGAGRCGGGGLLRHRCAVAVAADGRIWALRAWIWRPRSGLVLSLCRQYPALCGGGSSAAAGVPFVWRRWRRVRIGPPGSGSDPRSAPGLPAF